MSIPVSIRMTAVVVAMTMFMAQLDATVILTALPAMAADFGIGTVDLSIGITVYLVAQAIFLPTSAWLAERFGAKRVFAASVLLFTLTSLLCGLAQSLEQFVAARILQGISAALMTPVGRIILIRITPKSELVHIMALTSAPMLLGPTLGPAVGGFCVTYLSWHWAFFIKIPFGILSLFLIARYVPDLAREDRRPFDLPGLLLGGIAMSGLLLGLDRISASGSDWRISAIMILIGAAAGIVVVRHWWRASHPLLSLEPLKSQLFRITALHGGAATRIAARALPFLLPLMFQLSLGMSALTAGLVLMALNGADLVIKPLIRRVLGRFGFRSSLVASGLASATGTLACVAFSPTTPVWVIVATLTLLGGSRSVLFSGISSLLYADVPPERIASTTVLWSVLQQLTTALAVSLSAIMLNAIAAFGGRWGAPPELWDFRLVLLFHVLLGLIAIASFARLGRDAGADLSGHRG